MYDLTHFTQQLPLTNIAGEIYGSLIKDDENNIYLCPLKCDYNKTKSQKFLINILRIENSIKMKEAAIKQQILFSRNDFPEGFLRENLVELRLPSRELVEMGFIPFYVPFHLISPELQNSFREQQEKNIKSQEEQSEHLTTQASSSSGLLSRQPSNRQ